MLLIAPHGMRSARRRGQVGGVPPPRVVAGPERNGGRQDAWAPAASPRGGRRPGRPAAPVQVRRRTAHLAQSRAGDAPGCRPPRPAAPLHSGPSPGRAQGGPAGCPHAWGRPGPAYGQVWNASAPNSGTRPPRGEVRAQQVLWPVVRYGAAFKSDGLRVSPRLPGVSVCAPRAGHAPPRRAAPRVSPFGFRGWSQRLHRVRCPRDIGHRPDARGVA